MLVLLRGVISCLPFQKIRVTFVGRDAGEVWRLR
jgi:hypothetical protein